MTNEEQRYDAAHTLGVSYDASPSAVGRAYWRRLGVYWDLVCADTTARDADQFAAKADALYDARVRMLLPETAQWLANAIIKLGDGSWRERIVYRDVVRIIAARMGPAVHEYTTPLKNTLDDSFKLNRQRRAICALLIVSIWTVPGIDNNYAFLAGGALMLAMVGRLSVVMGKEIKNQQQQISESQALAEQLGAIWYLNREK